MVISLCLLVAQPGKSAPDRRTAVRPALAKRINQVGWSFSDLTRSRSDTSLPGYFSWQKVGLLNR